MALRAAGPGHHPQGPRRRQLRDHARRLRSRSRLLARLAELEHRGTARPRRPLGRRLRRRRPARRPAHRARRPAPTATLSGRVDGRRGRRGPQPGPRALPCRAGGGRPVRPSDQGGGRVSRPKSGRCYVPRARRRGSPHADAADRHRAVISAVHDGADDRARALAEQCVQVSMERLIELRLGPAGGASGPASEEGPRWAATRRPAAAGSALLDDARRGRRPPASATRSRASSTRSARHAADHSSRALPRRREGRRPATGRSGRHCAPGCSTRLRPLRAGVGGRLRRGARPPRRRARVAGVVAARRRTGPCSRCCSTWTRRHSAYSDYTHWDWFALPRDTGQRAVAGPYVDYLCSDEYSLTLSAPVTVGGRFIGVAAADVYLRRFEAVGHAAAPAAARTGPPGERARPRRRLDGPPPPGRLAQPRARTSRRYWPDRRRARTTTGCACCRATASR